MGCHRFRAGLEHAPHRIVVIQLTNVAAGILGSRHHVNGRDGECQEPASQWNCAIKRLTPSRD
jgi:hypothetical protein